MKKVLFVCTGNTCRSPMAEALFNSIANDTEFCASSCGIYADGVSPISSNAKKALSESGIEFSHTSRPLTQKLVDDADIIIGITANHARNIMASYPEYTDKIFAMPYDISDPYGGDIDVYRCCRDELLNCVKMILKTLNREDNNGNQTP